MRRLELWADTTVDMAMLAQAASTDLNRMREMEETARVCIVKDHRVGALEQRVCVEESAVRRDGNRATTIVVVESRRRGLLQPAH